MEARLNWHYLVWFLQKPDLCDFIIDMTFIKINFCFCLTEIKLKVFVNTLQLIQGFTGYYESQFKNFLDQINKLKELNGAINQYDL